MTDLKTRFGGLSYLLGLAFALKTMPMSTYCSDFECFR